MSREEKLRPCNLFSYSKYFYFTYCPLVFILMPGQVVHINKGRLHAFQKMAPSELLDTDCHCALRKQVLAHNQDLPKHPCCSLAWDWMYLGVTEEGIKREISSMLECSALNKKQMVESLGILETAQLLSLAKLAIADYKVKRRKSDYYAPDSIAVLHGILPVMRSVVNGHCSSQDDPSFDIDPVPDPMKKAPCSDP